MDQNLNPNTEPLCDAGRPSSLTSLAIWSLVILALWGLLVAGAWSLLSSHYQKQAAAPATSSSETSRQ